MGEVAPAATASGRWSSHRLQSILLRIVVYVAPLGASLVFVHFASKVVAPPAGSLLLYLLWWFGLSVAATGVLVAIDRVTRRLLPLAALLKLSLVFPDQAPSRFKVALRSGSVEKLEARLEATSAAAHAATPGEAAERLLELVAVLNIHDKLTRGHCDRVRAYSVMIGQELGLSPEELDLLNWAALLHDVGKLDVPSEILLKDGRPTDEEWEVLKKHPLFGEVLVEPMRDWLGSWAAAVGHHHERWDGKGYPRGLAGDDIPLPGRIVAVADVFDVITSVRSYKKASAAEEGRKEIARCAGTQFDPRVVRAFLGVSLGRMRFVMGPLSWLAHAPLLGRLPLTPAMGTLASALSVAAASTVGGLVAPAGPAAAAPQSVAAARSTPTPPSPARSDAGSIITVGRTGRHRTSLARQAKPSAATVASPVPAGLPGPPTTTAAPPPPPPPPATAPSSGGGEGTSTVPAPPANQPPRFSPGGNVVVREDDPAVAISWAHSIDAGAGGAGQHVSFETTVDAVDLFSSKPALSPDGVLTFTPAANAFGTAAATAVAVDDGGGSGASSPPRPFTITIAPVNDPPTFVGGGDVQALENGGPQAAAWAGSILAGPANESTQHVTFTTATDNRSLFTVDGPPLVSDDGVLTFTPALMAVGTANVTVTAHDDGGTSDGGSDSSTAQFRIVVQPRNQAPRLTDVGDLSVPEDTPAQSVQWVTSVDAGATSESSQKVTLSLASDHASLFSAQPALTQEGVLTYTPAPDANGVANVTVTAKDDGGTANGGHDTTTRAFTLTIRPVNDAPTFIAGGDQTVLENVGPQTVAWASAISTGPADESSQTVSFSVTNDDASLFDLSGQPEIAGDGTLTYTPAFGASGTAHVTVTANDGGGTADGGHDTSTASFSITVVAVNQAPSFAGGGPVQVLEDAGPQSMPWATAISAGANESSQTVTFLVTNDDNALFSAQPAVDSAGNLTFTSAPNANGTATVTVTAKDDGGTANGGQDTSAPHTFVLTVSPVNDPPSFTPGGDQTVLEDAGEQTQPWASAISAGPTDESAQTVAFAVTSDNAALFAAQPAIDPAGVLTYTPAADANGTATVTVVAQDDGGVAGGGVEHSSATFTITVTAVNDAPRFAGAGDQTVLEDAGAQSVSWATGIGGGPPDEASQTVTFAVTNDDNALFSAQPALTPNGLLTYTPARDAYGSATVTVVATDDGGTANGGQNTTTVTFAITVTPVNDAPTFTPISTQTVNEDDGPQTLAVTTLGPGPNETGQTLTVQASVDHPEYFAPGAQPSVDTSGVLSFTPAAGAVGTAVVTLTIKDDGGSSDGGVDTTTTTFSITIVPLPPIAGDDAYDVAALGAISTTAADGVLANDADVNSSTLTVTPQTVNPTPGGGTFTLRSDGSFDYTAGALPATDTFTYQITNDSGKTATATITFTVTLLGTTNTFFLGTTQLANQVFGLGSSAPGAVTPVPDADGDGHPGATLGKVAWTVDAGLLGISLHGPLTLHLDAATPNFTTGVTETVTVDVYDCPGGDTSSSTTGCTSIGTNKVLVPKWNVAPTYESHDLVVSVDHDIAVGRQLRIQLTVAGSGLWVPLVSPYESSFDYTG